MSAVMPEVPIWPVCDECDMPWALRRNLLDGKWLFTRDCKHKKASFTAHDGDGPLQHDGSAGSDIEAEGKR